MRVRRLFPRNLDDLRAELSELGGTSDDAETLLPRRRSVLLRLSDLTAEEVSTLGRVAPQAVQNCTLLLDEVRGNAVLMIRQDHLWEFCARLESENPKLVTLTKSVKESLSRGDRSGRAFRVGDRTYVRTGKPYIMGILNITPDSFADGGRFLEPNAALDHAYQMVEDGADFIDIGGESSRPGSQPVPLVEELRRVVPVVKKLAKKIDVPLSVDTTKAEVARRVLDAGARIINDISALGWDEKMAEVVAGAKATVVLMHMKGMPRTMQERPSYDDLMDEVHGFLSERITFALDVGIQTDRILVDPGIGFGKRLDDNFELLGRLREFCDLAPVLVGPSRKSFIGNVLDLSVGERLFGTAAAVTVATINGADVIRVHDVEAMRQAAVIAHRCMTGTARETTGKSRA
jgi:dihydropteroate synthase